MTSPSKQTQVEQIARRIRDLREISDYTAEEMAGACDVPLADYEAYESGATDIPISFLLAIAERFHVDMTEMTTGETPRLNVYQLTRAGAGTRVEREHHYFYRNLAYNFIRRKVEPLHVTVPLGVNPEAVPSRHEGHEFDYVLEGRLHLRIDDKDLFLEAGDSCYFDADHPHALVAAGDKDVKMLAVVIP